MHIYVIGTGPGNPALLTVDAKRAIEASTLLVGDKRMLEPFEGTGKELIRTYRRDEICRLASSRTETDGPMAVLVSGDVGFFSLAALLKDIPGCTVTRLAGISSLVYFAAALETSWNDVFIVSRHGRKEPLIPAVRQHAKVFVLTGGSESPASLCRSLCDAGLGAVRVAIGCNLSYDDEVILRGTAADFTERGDDALAVMMIENDDARLWQRPVHGLPDEAFLRGKAPMTKQEIRSVALSKLAPAADAVVYDIGAGTGSCTVELSLQAPFGRVYAFEMNADALAVLKQNIAHFDLANVTVVAGDAGERLKDIETPPDYAFIGGTKGRLAAILDELYGKNEACAIVVTAITIETLAALTAYYGSRRDYDLDITQVSTARSQKVGASHLMMAQNPIYIVTIVRKDETR